jgi:hypothetical protein
MSAELGLEAYFFRKQGREPQDNEEASEALPLPPRRLFQAGGSSAFEKYSRLWGP